MSETKQRYPLEWPTGWTRTPMHGRRNGTFGRNERQYSTVAGSNHSWNHKRPMTVAEAIRRILESLGRMGISQNDVVCSTNIALRLDGLPRSGEKEPGDPGAVVYWRVAANRPMRCMAIDRYTTVADNLAAIAATLEAMRAIERHGGAEILERTFTGFAALPAKASQPWRDVLGLTQDAGRAEVDLRFRELAKQHHPDAGGDRARFEEITQARAGALKELAP